MDWFPSNLAHLINRHKLVADDVAKVVDSSDGTISNWRKSVSKPRFAEIVKLLEYFDLNFEELFFTDLSNSNLIRNSNELELGQVAEPTTEYGNVKIEYRQITTYIERECPATGGKCYFDSLKEANLRIADLEKRLDEKEK